MSSKYFEILEKHGWFLEQKEPFYIIKNKNGDLASGEAIRHILISLNILPPDNSLFKEIKSSSEKIKDNRSVPYVLAHTMEEIGELAKEVAIEYLNSKKKVGVDGVVGEAIDSIICLVDLIHQHNPNLTEEELIEFAKTKLAKWERNHLNAIGENK